MVNKILEPVLIRSIELHMIIQTVILQLLERKGCSSLSQSVEKDLAVCPIRVCVQLRHPYLLCKASLSGVSELWMDMPLKSQDVSPIIQEHN